MAAKNLIDAFVTCRVAETMVTGSLLLAGVSG